MLAYPSEHLVQLDYVLFQTAQLSLGQFVGEDGQDLLLVLLFCFLSEDELLLDGLVVVGDRPQALSSLRVDAFEG